ncbi:glycosyltransferase family 39 protein [bacterium AH-315-A23]|nr:glycosyltransferase family 39 protein [bacterium AH-315-A23]
MLKIIEKYPIVILSLIVLLMLLVHLDIPNVTIMEARNFITAREMVNENHWLLTTMNGEARYQKPPLPTWLTAFSGLLFGMNNLFALRLPAALMVLFSGISLYYLSLKLNLSIKHSFNNSLIIVTSFYIVAILNEAPWDIFAHGFMLMGLYFLFQFFEEKKVLWKHAILSGVFIGFSILSKGPVSLFAVFIPFLISYAAIFKFKGIKKKLPALLGLVILFLSIGGWWFIYVRLADPEAFLKIATKETSNWSSYNVKPFYYYWSFFIQSGIWTIPAFISLLYPYLIKRVENKKAYKFTFWWVLSAVILLSLIPEKKPRYLVPVLIPLALNTGFYIQYLILHFSRLKIKRETIPVYFNFGFIAAIGIAVPILLYSIMKEVIQQHLFSYILTSFSLVLISIFIIKYLYRKKIQYVFYLTILFMVSVFTFGLPIATSLNKNEAYKSINALHQFERNTNISTYSIREITPELLWNYNGILKNIYKDDKLILPYEGKFGLLVLNNDVETILEKLTNTYAIQHIETFNLNVGSKKKERLIRQLYLISKK